MHAQPRRPEERQGRPLRLPSSGPNPFQITSHPLLPASNLNRCLPFQMEFFKVKIDAL